MFRTIFLMSCICLLVGCDSSSTPAADGQVVPGPDTSDLGSADHGSLLTASALPWLTGAA